MDAAKSSDKKLESFGFRSDSAAGGWRPITQISALALALLLGFGMGVTFRAGREARPPASPSGQSGQEARQSPQTTPNGSEELGVPQAPAPAKATANETAPSVAEAKASAPAEPRPAAANASTAATPSRQPVPKPSETAPLVTEAKTPPPAESPPAADLSQTATPGQQSAPPQPPLASYAYVYRFRKNGAFEFKAGTGKFENLLAARAAAITECRSKGGQNCKFNFAPVGGCIAVARPPSGEYRVSNIQPDEGSASADAMDQCLNEHGGGCRIVKVFCPQS